MNLNLHKISACLVVSVLMAGCETAAVKPDTLATPAVAACFTIAEPIESTQIVGLLKYEWRTRLERGAYVAIHEDARDTYFRGPPGALLIYQPSQMHKPSSLFTHITVNGGVFVPRDGSQPEIYNYFTQQSVEKVTPPVGASCANAVVVRDPQSKGVSVKEYALGGGLGGAAGGAAAYAKAPGAGLGQTVGVGAAGGAIGMAVVGAIINHDMGKIAPHAPSTDAKFNAQLAALAKTAQPLPQ